MVMVFQGLCIFLQVEVGIAQLAVNGAQGAQILRSHLNCCLKEGHSSPAIARLAQALTLQSQLQAGSLHPAPGTKKAKSLQMPHSAQPPSSEQGIISLTGPLLRRGNQHHIATNELCFRVLQKRRLKWKLQL